MTALFVPCYVDQFYPHVARATLRVLEAAEVAVDFPGGQTCCGQPVANAGMEGAGKAAAERYARTFGAYDHVVTPSGSCAAHVRHHHADVLPGARGVQSRTLELAEFLHRVVGLERMRELELRLPEPRVASLHIGCHALRGLRLASASERMDAPFDLVQDVLATVGNLEVRLAARPDECCGFGGTFAVAEPELSAKIGRDRLAGLMSAPPVGQEGSAPVDAVVSTDVSCAMHLEGLARRGGAGIEFFHLAELLAMALPGGRI